MTLHDLHLIGFFTGTVIHGSQVVLLGRHRGRLGEAAREETRVGVVVVSVCLAWQFGNFLIELFRSVPSLNHPATLGTAAWISGAALACFPLVFSYMASHPGTRFGSCLGSRQSAVLRWSRLLLGPWALLAIVCLTGGVTGFFTPPIDLRLVQNITLTLMLLFFVLFAAQSVTNARRADTVITGRSNRSGMVSSFVAVAAFAVMLAGVVLGLTGDSNLIGFIASLTSVPFSLHMAYRYYGFPFMDVYLRETLTGLMLLGAFLLFASFVVSGLPPDLQYFASTMAIFPLAWARAPLSRWVERRLLGFHETATEQEERIGQAIRQIDNLDRFAADAAPLLKDALEAEWIHIGPADRPGAVHRLAMAGSPGMHLSVGPRSGTRVYMSRQLNLMRYAALELSARHAHLAREAEERRRLVESHELREITAHAEIRALKAQINPHFFFNTLNVLANLIHSAPSRAELVIEQLAEIFRYALEATRRETVPLRNELAFVESYLSIEAARFGERLKYSIDMEPAAGATLIPPMVLQPVVENAVTHGINQKLEGGTIEIRATIHDGRLKVVVCDSGAGLGQSRHSGSGVALQNVRDRIRRMYGGQGYIDLSARPAGGTEAVLSLPVRVPEPSPAPASTEVGAG